MDEDRIDCPPELTARATLYKLVAPVTVFEHCFFGTGAKHGEPVALVQIVLAATGTRQILGGVCGHCVQQLFQRPSQEVIESLGVV